MTFELCFKGLSRSLPGKEVTEGLSGQRNSALQVEEGTEMSRMFGI